MDHLRGEITRTGGGNPEAPEKVKCRRYKAACKLQTLTKRIARPVWDQNELLRREGSSSSRLYIDPVSPTSTRSCHRYNRNVNIDCRRRLRNTS